MLDSNVFFFNFFYQTFNICIFIIQVYDANDENTVIGKMIVTVEMLDALHAIKNQLNEDRTELSHTYN